MSNEVNKAHGYRWAILIIAYLNVCIATYNQFQVTVFAEYIMDAIGMNETQFAGAAMAPMLIGVFTAIIGGVLADRFGVKKIVIFGIVISIIGCIARVFATTYPTFFISMLALGLTVVLINGNAIKLMAAWFPENQVGLAMGVVFAGGSSGAALSQATTALFPTANTAFIVGTILLGITFLGWLFIVKDKPKGTPDMPQAPVIDYLKQVMKSKNVWIIGICMILFMSFQMTYATFLPTAILSMGLDLAKAGLYASLFTVGGLLGSIIGPMISNATGVNKPTALLMSLVGGAIGILAFNFTDGILMAALLGVGGFLVGGVVPMCMSYPALLPEIGPVYAGTAGGLITTLQMAGAYIMPSYVITPIAMMGGAGINFSTMFAIASVCGALIGVMVLILPELGRKALEKRSM